VHKVMQSSFDESRFRSQVDNALRTLRTVLENTREPLLAENVAHSYQDKYMLAEFLGNASLSAQLACLDIIGANISVLAKLKEWARTNAVTFRFRGEEKCDFVREETRKEESKTQHVSERESSLFGKSTRTDKIITTITEYFWNFTVNYELVAFQGTNVSEAIPLRSRTGTYEIKTTSKNTPKPKVSVLNDLDVEVSWYLQQFNDSFRPSFSINRASKTCYTPRRNDDVEAALNFYTKYFHWSTNVENYFRKRLFPVQTRHALDMSAISNSGVFVPVVPLFEANAAKRIAASSTAGGPESDEQTVIIPTSDIDRFMDEQKRSLGERLRRLENSFPSQGNLITQAEVTMVLSLMHSRSICQYFLDGVNYIESMLRKQLIAAVGKEVQPVDLIEYMAYHNRRLFKPEFAPELFCYSIRRPDHYPEGVLSIEAQNGYPVPVFAHRIEGEHPMKFSINAATTVTFKGARYVHAWIDHTFSGHTGTSLRLSARARQFSSFILVIGNVISANSFNPKHAIIIQNKDDLLIPLLLEQIPTPKAFRDAIESLSPEQQRFAKAFRSMQLESTLFGICVIQIKPQLEKLLNLPNDSLTKEIQLTQDLLELFISYQVPSDLLSYDGDENLAVSTKVQRVRALVEAMQAMIRQSKERELEEARQKAEYERQLRLKEEAEKQARERERIQLLNMEMERKEMCRERKSSAVKYKKSSAPRMMSKGAMPQRCAAPVAMNLCAAPSMSAVPLVKQRSASKPAPVSSNTQAVPASKPKPAAVSKPVEAPKPVEAKPVEAPKVEAKQPEDRSEVQNENQLDFTKLPGKLDQNFEALDLDAALHSTIITAGLNWTKKYQKALLSPMTSVAMDTDKQKEERNTAFDLLDALSRSGVLDVNEAEFHVVLAATHCFDQTLMDTLIKKNMNPIEKLERSMLIIASTITELPVEELINPAFLPMVQHTAPNLFE